jgi:hypothetical protein
MKDEQEKEREKLSKPVTYKYIQVHTRKQQRTTYFLNQWREFFQQVLVLWINDKKIIQLYQNLSLCRPVDFYQHARVPFGRKQNKKINGPLHSINNNNQFNMC